MSVLVKGMEMPSGCAACPLWARCYELFAAQERFIHERPEWCPLAAEKRGKWIDGAADFTNGNKTHECSYCGGYIDMYKGGADDYYFCPYCGARMDLEGDKE